MLELKRCVTIGLVVASLLFCSVVAAAGPAGEERELPRFYSPRSLDGTPVTLSDESGRSWVAWSYWSGRESAIAISTRDTDGLWSEPVLLGLDDQVSQVDPALTRDAAGNLYLAFAVRETGTVWMTALFGSSDDWFAPQLVIEPGQRASAPELLVIGDRLVLGTYGRGGVRLQQFELLPDPAGFDPNGVQEGPDGFPSMGMMQEPPNDPDLPGDDDPSQPGESGSFGKGSSSSDNSGGASGQRTPRR